ncbi:MAG: GNAT family N-acetyltransferase [Burkholderiales bacterium]|nr:GNAT family N-acetyltransferase [Burkholderiales bacterium]MDE1927695.1 GNAT family N-acetyltransferase [Burkholderiales bacterium]MDE2158000.1 GNAT family N-acetyltransferase [Burkholderiales bacterium]MDE2502102.1 GNAT family N-acetyltransferase [Burkholderiales bacterium]
MPESNDLARRAALHLDRSWRALARDDAAVHRPAYIRVITGMAHPLGNVAIVNDAADAADLAEAAQPLVDGAWPATVIGCAAWPATAASWLAAAGFSSVESMPAMVVDIAELPATGLPAGCEWLRVEPAQAAEFTSVLAVGFEMPPALARRFSPATLGIDPAPAAATQYYAIRCGGRLVATSVLFLADGLAGIYSVATLPEFRGRGLGRHATSQPLRVAAALGYRIGVLQSSAAGYPVYRGLGFRETGRLPVCMRVPG